MKNLMDIQKYIENTTPKHKDGVYHCQMFQCPYRASFYCMMTCKGVKKTEEKKKEA